MVYHITVSLVVGSHIEDKYCICESIGNKERVIDILSDVILNKGTLHLKCDPNKVNDGKKTSYIMRCKDICCIAISEK